MNKYKNIEVEITYPFVRNLSKDLDKVNYNNLCAIVVFSCNETDINCSSTKNLNIPSNLKKIIFDNQIILYI